MRWRRRRHSHADVEATRLVAIVIRPEQMEQFDHDDLADLVFDLCRSTDIPADHIDVRLTYLIGDAPAPGWEGWTTVTFVLDEAGRAALGSAIDAAVHWARGWLGKGRGEEGMGVGLRFIYGPTGEVLKKVKVRDERRYQRRGAVTSSPGLSRHVRRVERVG
jgi:hypothetical protein